jgi:hypothetical protein
MRLKEFIKEAGRNGSNEFDAAPGAAPAETPAWLKNAGKYLANKIGLKEPVSLEPGALPPEPKKSTYKGIDPIVRQQAGLPPATHQEIDAYVKANPPVVGGLTGRDGKPVLSGGALELERAAREAAPREFYPPLEKAAVPPAPAAGMSDAEIAANAQRIKTPREQGNYLNKDFDDRSFDRSPVAPGGSEAPRTTVAAPSSAAVQGGADSRLSKFPAVAAAAAAEPAPAAVAAAVPTTTIKTEPIAAVGGDQTAAGPKLNRLTGKVDGENTEQDDAALARIKDLSQDPKLDTSKAKSGDQTVNIGGKSGDADADVGPVVEPKKDQKKKPSDTKSSVNGGINISPTVFAYATNIGLIQNGKLDIERIRKFQRSQNIEDDGIIGKDTSNAILSVGNAYQGAGTGRGDSGNPGSTRINVDEPKNAGYVEPLPGVKDSKGRQVWKKADGVLAGFDPYEHRMYRIGNINKLMRDPYAGEFRPTSAAGINKPQPIGKTNEGLTIYQYANGRFGAWDADNRKMIPIDAPSSQATVVKESSDMQRMRLLAGLTGK